MLNRRYIRVKVMQALYALEQAKKANYELALELIEEDFTPAWNDEEGRENITILKKYQAVASKIFGLAQSDNDTQVLADKGENITQKAIKHYEEQENTLKDLDKVYDLYLIVLSFFSELHGFSIYQNIDIDHQKHLHLSNNDILKALKTHQSFQNKSDSMSISWNKNIELVENIYLAITQDNEKYEVFLEKNIENPDKKLEAHKEVIAYIIEDILFKNEEFNTYFEGLDDNWSENKEIVKNMLNYTFRSIKNIKIVKQSSFPLLSNKRKALQKAVQKAIVFYVNQVSKDSKTFHKNLLNESEKIYNAYLAILLFLSELNNFALNQDTKIDYKQGINLANNSILESLIKHDSFQRKITSRQIDWNANRDLLRDIYRKIARRNEDYEVFLAKNPNNENEKLEFDKELITYITKNILFENQDFKEYFENLDLNWEENYKIVRSMLNRTFKDIKDPLIVEEANFPLSDIAKNWEDDEIFFEDLYEYNVENEVKLYKIIEEKAKNWEMERLALIDQIILKMGISEMLDFQTIPIKVSINEYIEISKLYSTPKSKQFINGLLDKTARYLKEKGEIKKSARGLMDNK